MKIIYSGAHDLHHPLFGMDPEGRVPISDVPDRALDILRALDAASIGTVIAPGEVDRTTLQRVHSPEYLEYLRTAYQAWCDAGEPESGVLPDVFPAFRPANPGRSPAKRAGWFAFDLLAPIVRGTYEAALAAASVALTGARLLTAGESLAYALCRPPGHHAGPDFLGGYCYLNNAAIAATMLSESGDKPHRVAILDIDAHHGNGTQTVFYDSPDVFFASLHADPNDDYPYYWGFAEERGVGDGEGTNLNIPLPLGTEDEAYCDALQRALDAVVQFSAEYLVVSLGTDSLASDAVGELALSNDCFGRLGKLVGALRTPTLVVQEGGYVLGEMGDCVAGFLAGLETRNKQD